MTAPTAAVGTGSGAGPDVAQSLDAAVSVCATAAAGYQLLGPKLADPALAQQARAAEQAQRDARDAALRRMAALNVAPTGAGQLSLPARVPDDLSARALATRLEDAAAASWRALLSAAMRPDADDPQPTRALALAQLQSAAVRASSWRIAAGSPPSVPFPGLNT